MKFKQIGKGVFSRVYDMGNGRVLISSVDPVKECIANGWCGDSGLIPKIQCEDKGNFPGYAKQDSCLYSMDYYPRVKSLKNSLDPDQWVLYKSLKKLEGDFIIECCIDFYHDRKTATVYLLRNTIKKSSLPENVKEELTAVVEGLTNYGDKLCFEISPRNVAVKEGKLILLDCFFFSCMLRSRLKY